MIASPERITQARELTGLSKTELAELLDVTPAAVAQWERGAKHPTAENIAALARHLGVPMTMLLKERPAELLRKGPLTFRAWASAKTRRANRKAQRLAELIAEVFLWLEEKISFPKPEFPEFEHRELANKRILEIATLCRRAWHLGDLPILKLGELLESKGIVLSTATFGDDRFDAFSCIVNGRPFVLLGDDKQDRARSRFDTAHELGHLVLHQHWTEADFAKPEIHKRIEKEANLFAAAFL